MWTKPVLPDGSLAVAFLYVMQSGGPIKVTFNLNQLNLTSPSGYQITEVFEGKDLGNFHSSQNFSCYVNPTGVYVIKATELKAKRQVSRIRDKYYRKYRELKFISMRSKASLYEMLLEVLETRNL